MFSGRDPKKSGARVMAGVLLGFGGLGLIFSDGWADFARPEYQLGIAGCFASCVTWSLGTVMSKQWNSLEVSPLVNSGLRILAEGYRSHFYEPVFRPFLPYQPHY
jgi:drug/metabolite transporter (DMT)-like permease